MYQALKSALDEMDTKLDSLSDAEAAGKRKITNELVERFKGNWEPFAAKIVEQFQALDEDTLVGVYNGVVRELRSHFEEPSNKRVTSLVESQPKAEVQITEDEAKKLSTQRSEAYQQIKQVIELAQSWGEEGAENWEMPKPRRGARGKRGKRALSYYNWFIDGEAVPADDNSVAGVYKLLGFDKAKDFTEFLRSNKIDTREPAPEFEVTYNGKQVRAVRSADAPVEASDDSEPENGEEEDDDAYEEPDETPEAE